MQEGDIKSGRNPVGADVSLNIYATVNPLPPEPGSRLQDAASPAGPKAAPARGTGGATAIAARLPPCSRSAAAGSSEVIATSRGMSTFCPAPQSEAYHLPMGFGTEPFSPFQVFLQTGSLGSCARKGGGPEAHRRSSAAKRGLFELGVLRGGRPCGRTCHANGGRAP